MKNPNPSTEEVTMRGQIENIYWESVAELPKYTTASLPDLFIPKIQALFQQKLEEREKELIDKAREISHQKGYILNDIRFIKLEDLETLGGRK